VVDALIERQDGVIVLKEWKTSSEVSQVRKRQYELQARVGALAIGHQNSHEINRLEIVPLFYPENTIALEYNKTFIQESQQMLERVFKDLRDRNYESRWGEHCKLCQLNPQCPDR
jgi:predicted RecB family nuclease